MKLIEKHISDEILRFHTIKVGECYRTLVDGNFWLKITDAEGFNLNHNVIISFNSMHVIDKVYKKCEITFL